MKYRSSNQLGMARAFNLANFGEIMALMLTLKKNQYVDFHHGLIKIKIINGKYIAIDCPREIKIERITGDFLRSGNDGQKSEHSRNINSVPENKEDS